MRVAFPGVLVQTLLPSNHASPAAFPPGVAGSGSGSCVGTSSRFEDPSEAAMDAARDDGLKPHGICCMWSIRSVTAVLLVAAEMPIINLFIMFLWSNSTHTIQQNFNR